MRPMTRPAQNEHWLVCPTTPEQTDAYWQAVASWRPFGIELVLCPTHAPSPLPWDGLGAKGRWRGLVLWPDAMGQRLWREALSHGVQVRCLVSDPRMGLQPWSADWPSGQSRI